MRAPVKGLYAVTPDGLEPALLMELTDAAIAGGATMIQYRDKTASRFDLKRRGAALVALCRARHVPLIVNDHVDLALELGADGVHVGEHDDAVASARERLGSERLVGASCYQSVDSARLAATQGASYVAFGSVFASAVKPDATGAPLSLFAEARNAGLDLPLVGIGGITHDNLALLIEAGASAAAVITGVFGSLQRDAVFSDARRLSLLFFSSVQ